MEIWKDVPTFENYQASNFGQVRSKITGTIMRACKNHPNERGYYQLSLTISTNQRVTRKVHTLVCLAFHGLPPTPAHTVNHKDGNKLNNHESNLEWMTRSEQSKHSYHDLHNIKTRPRGKDVHWRANYSDDEVRLIRSLHRQGLGYHRIRTALGCKTSWVAIQMLITGKTYTHVKD